MSSEAGGRTLVAFHPIVPVMSAAGVPDALAARLEPAHILSIKAIQS